MSASVVNITYLCTVLSTAYTSHVIIGDTSSGLFVLLELSRCHIIFLSRILLFVS